MIQPIKMSCGTAYYVDTSKSKVLLYAEIGSGVAILDKSIVVNILIMQC
jgi:hypothetical protein